MGHGTQILHQNRPSVREIRNYKEKLFSQTLKSSCEPTMFSLEQLLFAFVKDSRTPLQVLTAIEPILNEVLDKEFKSRRHLEKLGLAVSILFSVQ